ncbi:Crp/Fnr family transcriptional regulator [Aquifex aeolicus]|uniref:Transcriptional regulator (Crp/Fnr family) n=1 Tax=Aquifex aeolicus (strain VF5) TaxID=224324 RepID=O66781_AQUAE|nr:helix-turn-helix domain-containing protein [Aquifex aeolicus]AAC06741.1 transcriptional regulator (Crp/Fnr family) [Aquifex aeolicus VF5]
MAQGAFSKGQTPEDLKIDLLKKTHLFEDLSPQELREVAKYIQVRNYMKGEYIFFEEEAEPGIFILVEGLVKLIKETSDGRSIIVRLVFPGEVFGWIEWGKSVPKFKYTAMAALPSTILYISNKYFINLAIKYPAIAIKLTCDATHNLLQTYEVLKSIASGKVEERIAKLLLELAEKAGEKKDGRIIIRLPLTRQDIAEMTGTTVETTIRVMSKWKKQGIINTERGYIEIIDKKALEKLVV